jgi:N6-adenosine-specific RNA methylase IME4
MASKSKAKAKRAGPSKRTQAVRDTINKRAAASPAKPKVAAKPRRTITIAGQPTRYIREIKIGERHRKDMGDLVGLAKSIDERGALLQPIVIDKDNNLIAGQRRLAAWPLTRFRKEPIPVTVVDIDAIVAGEWDENAKRKDFTPSECASIARALEPIAAAKAKERQGKKDASGTGLDSKGNAADLVAAYVGKDRKTIQRAQEVIDAAEQDPEKFGPLRDQMDKTGKVNGAWRRLQVHNQVADIKTRKANGTLAVPEGKFDRIVADIPWPYEADDEHPDERGRAARKYATISIKAAKALPIAERCAANTVIYFATTNFHMEFAYQILRAWGFTQFPTILTWAKTDGFGRGQRLRNKTEHWIIGIKGKPVWNLTNQTTLLEAPTTGEDSEKPAAFYALIDELTPAERSLELFARRELPAGWVGFGDQVGTLKGEERPAPTRVLTELEMLARIEAGGELISPAAAASLKEQKLARGSVKLKLTKAGIARLKKLREENSSAAGGQQAADGGDDDQVQENSIPQVDCRVCSDGNGLCAECVAAGEHIISMTNPRGLSVATCSCGWRNEMPWGSHGFQDQEVKAHWQNVVTEPKASAASTAADDLPESLRRGPDGLAPYQRSEAAE